MNMINDVAAFMRAGGQENTLEQVAKQLGFVLEESCEAINAAGEGFPSELSQLSYDYKTCHAPLLELLEEANKTELLDAFLDIAWVAIGGAIAMGADVPGAWAEVVRSNMSKVDPATGKMIKDEHGKVIKPPNFSKPELAQFLTEEKK